MGSRLFSNTTGLLGGHDFGNEHHRQKVAGILGIPPDAIPTEASDSYDRIIEKILSGNVAIRVDDPRSDNPLVLEEVNGEAR